MARSARRSHPQRESCRWGCFTAGGVHGAVIEFTLDVAQGLGPRQPSRYDWYDRHYQPNLLPLSCLTTLSFQQLSVKLSVTVSDSQLLADSC